jgi:hypothetical protein
MLHRGIEYSVVQGIERHHWKWAATVAGTKMGMAARGTRRLVTRKKPSSALSRSNASGRIKIAKIDAYLESR